MVKITQLFPPIMVVAEKLVDSRKDFYSIDFYSNPTCKRTVSVLNFHWKPQTVNQELHADSASSSNHTQSVMSSSAAFPKEWTEIGHGPLPHLIFVPKFSSPTPKPSAPAEILYPMAREPWQQRDRAYRLIFPLPHAWFPKTTSFIFPNYRGSLIN